jgi:hypothetical protein
MFLCLSIIEEAWKDENKIAFHRPSCFRSAHCNVPKYSHSSIGFGLRRRRKDGRADRTTFSGRNNERSTAIIFGFGATHSAAIDGFGFRGRRWQTNGTAFSSYPLRIITIRCHTTNIAMMVHRGRLCFFGGSSNNYRALGGRWSDRRNLGRLGRLAHGATRTGSPDHLVARQRDAHHLLATIHFVRASRDRFACRSRVLTKRGVQHGDDNENEKGLLR